MKKWYKINIDKLKKDNISLYYLETKNKLPRNSLYTVFYGAKKVSNKHKYFEVLKPYLDEIIETKKGLK